MKFHARFGWIAFARTLILICLVCVGCAGKGTPPSAENPLDDDEEVIPSPDPGEGATLRTGTLEQSETWTGVVLITREVIVPEGKTLTIDTNARVQFTVGVEPSSKIIVQGNIYVQGNLQRSALFSAEDRTKQWHGIVLDTGSSANFTYAQFLLETKVHCRTNSARFAYCQFMDNSGPALTIEGCAPTVEDSMFRSNVVGIYCARQASPDIANNSIIGNLYGVICEDGSQPNITRNIIANNRQHGVVSRGASSPQISSNNLLRNGGYAVMDGGRLSDNFVQGNNGVHPNAVETSLNPQNPQMFGVEEIISARPSPVTEAGERRLR